MSKKTTQSHYQPKPLINYLASLLLLLSGWALAQNLQDVTMVKEIERHAPVRGMALSPDDKLMAIGATDGTVQIIEVATDRVLYNFQGHSAAVLSVAFSPDGSFLASGSGDKTVKIWRTADFSLVDSLEEHTNSVLSVAFSPAGDFLASGSNDNTVKIWRTPDFSLVDSLEEHTDWVRSVAFSPAGDFLASGSDDNTVKIWRTPDFSLVHSLEEHTHFVYSVAFSPAGDFLASGSEDNTVKIWRTADFSLVASLEEHTSSVRSVAFSPAGDFLASGSSDNTVKIWQVASGRLLRNFTEHSASVYNVTFSHDGRFLASRQTGSSSSDDGSRVKLWATPNQAAVFCPRCGELAPQLSVLSPSNNSRLQSNQTSLELDLSVGAASGVDFVVQANGYVLNILSGRNFAVQGRDNHHPAVGNHRLVVAIPSALRNQDLNLNIRASNSVGSANQNLQLVAYRQPARQMHALLMGNSLYADEDLVLTNPANDIRELASLLAGIGFRVDVQHNLTSKREMRSRIQHFADGIGADDIALVYYSGHGMQVNNINYLIPTHASLDSLAALEDDSVGLDYVLRVLELQGIKTNIIIMDACRDEPIFRGIGRGQVQRGLANMSPPGGTLIAYAAAPGEKALDYLPQCPHNPQLRAANEQCRLSPYTTALSAVLKNADLRVESLTSLLHKVQIEVYNSTDGQQRPATNNFLHEVVFLAQ